MTTPRSRPARRPRPGRAEQRLEGLFQAQRLITADLSLATLLDRIVTAACDLVGAQYGAVGVVAEDGSIEHFVHHGMDADTVTRLGHLPRGRGLLDAVLHDPVTVRVADVTTDERSEGMSTAQSPMRSFLGVPIRVRGEAFGELYLADQRVDAFDAGDEDVVTALAASAGTAIANARLYEQARRSRDWLDAAGEVARALLADADEAALMEIVSRALDIADADYVALILPTEDARLRVVVAKGPGADVFQDLEFDPALSPLGQAIIAGESRRTPEFLEWASPSFAGGHDYGPAMIAPLVDARGSRGALLMVRQRHGLAFTAQDVAQAATFAAQVALALQLDDARADAEWLRVLEQRHRIAQDLHDNVMQRLFATGVGLQTLAESIHDPETAERMRRYIADLDETIDQIRSRVFGLRSDDPPELRRRRGRYPRVSTPGVESARTGVEPPNVRTLTPGRTRREDPDPPA